MDKDALIEKSKEIFFPLFPPQAVVPERGEGCAVFDTDGKRYLDFAAGIAVNSLGHAHEGYAAVAAEQLRKLTLVPATYITRPKVECAEFLVRNSCFDQVFFTNSGTEAIEGCLKLVRKWAYEEKGPECNEIIAFRKAFHGRTMGAASLTNKREGQPYYAPYLGGIQFANFNEIESVKALVSDDTAAIFVEPVQGEGGIVPADRDFLKGLRALCDENNIALVFDEIQAGMGRIGTFFAYEQFGVEPDLAALAKGLGNGFPIGALLAKKKFGDHFTAGSHGSTYGGNALATSLALYVMTQIKAPGFLENVRAMGARLIDGLHEISRRTNRIEDVRGMGLMVGIDTAADIKALRVMLQDRGLLTTQAGERTLRLTPPLIAGAAEIDEALSIIETVLQQAPDEGATTEATP